MPGDWALIIRPSSRGRKPPGQGLPGPGLTAIARGLTDPHQAFTDSSSQTLLLIHTVSVLDPDEISPSSLLPTSSLSLDNHINYHMQIEFNRGRYCSLANKYACSTIGHSWLLNFRTSQAASLPLPGQRSNRPVLSIVNLSSLKLMLGLHDINFSHMPYLYCTHNYAISHPEHAMYMYMYDNVSCSLDFNKSSMTV